MSLPEITVNVAKAKEGLLKILWSEGPSSFQPYAIDRNRVGRRSAELRRNLRALVDEAFKSGGCHACGLLLKKLAETGARLREDLFKDHRGGNTPDTVKHWLTGKGRSRITFRMDDLIHVPWGLVYDGDPSLIPDDPEQVAIKTFPGFWCIKHRQASIYNLLTPADRDRARFFSAVGGPPPARSFSLLPAVHEAIFKKAVGALKSDKEKAGIARTFAPPNEPAHRSADLYARFRGLNDGNHLLYFYCHADGSSLSLGVGDNITIDDFGDHLNTARADLRQVACLVFLNGCSTASGHSEGGFLEATGRTPFSGFVGTEAAVPDVFALRFGHAFLEGLKRTGGPVIDVMHELRLKHWPLSLLYGVYCVPEFRVDVKPPSGPDAFYAAKTSFSDSKLGTDLIS